MSSNTKEGWELEAREIESVPEDATVISQNNESIRNVGPVRELLDSIESDGKIHTKKLSTSEYKEVNNSLNELPAYDGDGGPSGWYVRVGNQTYVLSLIKQT
jgi:hypothetical protein